MKHKIVGKCGFCGGNVAASGKFQYGPPMNRYTTWEREHCLSCGAISAWEDRLARRKDDPPAPARPAVLPMIERRK